LANGANPVAIVIPCHRVIGTDGSLTGYGGGISRKRWLLLHEGVALEKSATRKIPEGDRCVTIVAIEIGAQAHV
jgi:alkylated DNA nucleotide flippase Atl1